MSVLLTRGTRLSQPQGPVEIDASWVCVNVPGVFTSGSADPAATLVGGAYDVGPGGRRYNNIARGNYLSFGNNQGMKLSKQSGVMEFYLPDAANYAVLFSTGITTGSAQPGSLNIAVRPSVNGNLVELTEQAVSVIGLTTNAANRTGGRNRLAWSYNSQTGLCTLVLNGIVTQSVSAKTLTHVGTVAIGAYIIGTTTATSIQQHTLFALSKDERTPSQLLQLCANPWQLFKPVQRRVWFDGGAAAGGASQTIAFTLDDITSSVSQTLSHSQSAAFTLDGISSTVNQAATHSQSLSATLDDVTVSISQELAGAKSQSIAFTLDGITASVSQTASHAQSLAVTLDDVTVSISQSAAPSSKDQSLAITLDDIFVDIKQAGPRRRQAGGKRNYIIKGKKYHLNDYELAVMIQGMLEEVERSDVEIDDGEAVKKVSRRVWKQLKESNAQLDFTLKELQSKVAIQEIDDEDDIALLML